MSIVNTNVASLIAQKNFGKGKSSQETAMERLSSGMRINSAKDDAAGQAIANRLSAQINGLSQSQRNANDGISLAQTAEGALDQINENVQRIRQLTVQAKNGTNNRDDLKSIQAEITQRITEIDRISADTDFNGTKVLAADSNMTIQVGADDGQTIPIELPMMNTKTLDVANFSVAGFPEVTTDQLQSIFGAELQTTLFEQEVGAGGTVTYSVDAASGAVTNEAGNVLNVATDGTLTEDAIETNFPITAGDILATDSGWEVERIANQDATLSDLIDITLALGGDHIGAIGDEYPHAYYPLHEDESYFPDFGVGDGFYHMLPITYDDIEDFVKGEAMTIYTETETFNIVFDENGDISDLNGIAVSSTNTLIRNDGALVIGDSGDGDININNYYDLFGGYTDSVFGPEVDKFNAVVNDKNLIFRGKRGSFNQAAVRAYPKAEIEAYLLNKDTWALNHNALHPNPDPIRSVIYTGASDRSVYLY